MKYLRGIITDMPYYYRDILQNYNIRFSLQVDRKDHISGEIAIIYISKRSILLKKGDKIELKGSFQHPYFISHYHISL